MASFRGLFIYLSLECLFLAHITGKDINRFGGHLKICLYIQDYGDGELDPEVELKAREHQDQVMSHVVGSRREDSGGCRNEPCKKLGSEEKARWNPAETLTIFKI